MTTSTRLKAVLVPAIAVAASLLLAGCFQIGPPSTDNDDTDQTTETSDTDTDTDSEGETVDVFSIAVGDCILEGTADTEVSETTVVPCDEPHTYEVFADSTLADGDFPGDEAVTTQADADCYAQFEGFVGLAYEESAYEYNYFVPTEGSWESGDREVLCLVYDPSGDTSGSLSGINQ